MNSIRYIGHLMATSYWHVTSDSSDNLTRVMRGNLVAGISDPDGRSPHQSPIISSVPLVPSNSVRGRLHRHTLSILTEALLARGESFDRETYQMLSNGGMVGGGENNKLTVGETLRARRHIHFGLWGGGPRLMPSSVVTRDLVPVCAETIQANRIPPALRGFAPNRIHYVGDQQQPSPATGRDLIVRRMFKKNDDMMQVNADAMSRLAVLGADAHQIIANYQAEQLGFREARKEAKASTEGRAKHTLSDDEQLALKKRDSVNYLEIEAVIPGTVWPVDLRLASYVSPAQIALFSRGLERFVAHQALGGLGRWGFGQYRAYLEIVGPDGHIGSLRWNDELQDHVLTFANDSYDAALADALACVNVSETAAFAVVPDSAPVAGDKAKKPRKGAAHKAGQVPAEAEA